ncbi:MAG: DUF5667 domain-containing protein [Anaerolineae bacterium]|nr:DUF5667 domain-containing protein [Anaerolineae bacterium]
MEASKTRSLKTMLSKAEQLAYSSAVKVKKTSDFARWQRLPKFQRIALVIMVVMSCLISVGGGGVYASGTSIPGDPLYPIKLVYEDTQRFFTWNTERRFLLEERLAKKRLWEVAEVLEENRQVAVNFNGILYDIQPNQWIIDNLIVRIPQEALIKGHPYVGCYVDVQGHTAAQRDIIASLINVQGESFKSIIDAVNEDFLTINDMKYAYSKQIAPDPDELIGDEVSIYTRNLPNGDRYIIHIAPFTAAFEEYSRTELTGELEEKNGNQWQVTDTIVYITPQTIYDSDLDIGDILKITAIRDLYGQIYAIEIESVTEFPDSHHGSEPDEETEHPDDYSADIKPSESIEENSDKNDGDKNLPVNDQAPSDSNDDEDQHTEDQDDDEQNSDSNDDIDEDHGEDEDHTENHDEHDLSESENKDEE